MILEYEAPPERPDQMEAGAPLPPRPERAPGGFARRGVAYLIDLLILQFLYTLLFLAGLWAVHLASPRSTWIDALTDPTFFPFSAIWIILFTAYFTFFHSYGGQTPGKLLVRIQVVSDEGGPLPPFRALIRSAGYFLSGFFLLGFLLALIDKRGRALHDLLAKSEVVQS